ncbi:DEAD/DEAH box helicase [Klebsiella aerogenes]|uniref:protein DpdF n=1 Tax=Klebsiella aerogenes TaxID=548 RepID=UPI002DB8779C|nr:protein DpdF [Klebsiella aerogenes]MEB6655747.1 DEAD/DEAH box helicase [Klebsiella aerogenes]
MESEDAQWPLLRNVLKGQYERIHEITQPFYRRLLAILEGDVCGAGDKLHAFYDALQCARASGARILRLPLPDRRITNSLLAPFGLIRCQDMPSEIMLIDATAVPAEFDAVWRLDKRRTLSSPPLDSLLANQLKDPQYHHYSTAGQQMAVRAVLTSPEDKTLVINLPTGAGKTFVIHALMLNTQKDRLTLVIVPTIGLAIEQAQRAKEILAQAKEDHGGAYAWYGDQSTEQKADIHQRLKSGEQRILFCSPESARGSLLTSLFYLAQKGMLGALVVDEAHLIDQWGAEFRPEFQLLSPLVHSLKDVSSRGFRTVLLSATWHQTTLDTLKHLFIGDTAHCIEINGSFLRPEPVWFVNREVDEHHHHQRVVEAIATLPRPLIIYATKVAEAEYWHQWLLEQGYLRSGLFHGNTPIKQREQLIECWQGDQLDIVVATSAFGVGMDKSNVRSVLHVAVPENIDRFYQESGRGGRDGNACIAWMIYHPLQLSVASKLNRRKLIGARKGRMRWQALHQDATLTARHHLTVTLTSKHDKLTLDSKNNVAWNWRTLLLMRRAGFLRMHFSVPNVAAVVDDLTDENAVDDYYRDYFNHVQVEVMRGDLRVDSIWNETFNRYRSQEFSARERGYEVLADWLMATDRRAFCRELAAFYTLNGIMPQMACGGCPGCRADHRGIFTPTLGNNVCTTGLRAEAWPGRHQNIYYNESKPAKLLLREWQYWISTLLHKKQIAAIRANRMVLDELAKILPKGTPFWCSLEPKDANNHWDELLLVMPEDVFQFPDNYSEVNRIIVAPRQRKDVRHPGRQWWEGDSEAQSLEHFQRTLSYVNH